MVKGCTKCGKEYCAPLEKWFYKSTREKDGFQYTCKNCVRGNRCSDKSRQHIQKYNKSKSGRLAAKKYRNTKKGRLANKISQLKTKYGLSLLRFNMLFHKQEGCCAICGKHQSELKVNLSVDHDHQTGKVRGLLCFNCNTGMGNLGDNTELLLKAVAYLKGATDDNS